MIPALLSHGKGNHISEEEGLKIDVDVKVITKRSLGWLSLLTVSYHEPVNTLDTSSQSIALALVPHVVSSAFTWVPRVLQGEIGVTPE